MSAEGTPSETPGHKVLTDEQKDLVREDPRGSGTHQGAC